MLCILLRGLTHTHKCRIDSKVDLKEKLKLLAGHIVLAKQVGNESVPEFEECVPATTIKSSTHHLNDVLVILNEGFVEAVSRLVVQFILQLLSCLVETELQ